MGRKNRRVPLLFGDRSQTRNSIDSRFAANSHSVAEKRFHQRNGNKNKSFSSIANFFWNFLPLFKLFKTLRSSALFRPSGAWKGNFGRWGGVNDIINGCTDWVFTFDSQSAATPWRHQPRPRFRCKILFPGDFLGPLGGGGWDRITIRIPSAPQIEENREFSRNRKFLIILASFRRRLKSDTDWRNRSNGSICIINRRITICTCISITSNSKPRGLTLEKLICWPKLLIGSKLLATNFMQNLCCLLRWRKMIRFSRDFATADLFNWLTDLFDWLPNWWKNTKTNERLSENFYVDTFSFCRIFSCGPLPQEGPKARFKIPSATEFFHIAPVCPKGTTSSSSELFATDRQQAGRKARFILRSARRFFHIAQCRKFASRYEGWTGP